MSKAVYYFLNNSAGPCINVAESEESSHTSYIYLREAPNYKAPRLPGSWTNKCGYAHASLRDGRNKAVRITRCRARQLLTQAGLGHLPLY